MKNFGTILKKSRIINHVTQQELADMLYVSNKTISSWECDRTVPDISIIIKIANTLNINLYELLDDMYKESDNLEIQFKLKVNEDEFNRIKSNIKNKNYICCNQVDDYYISKYRKFNYEWLRVRNEDGKYTLTYKKKIANNCCEEYDVVVYNYFNLKFILETIGVEKKGTIVKEREKIIYNNKYEIAFDKVENIGFFIEIEVIEKDNNNEIEIKQIIDLIKKLKIDLSLIEIKRYYDYL